jgi:hypothetical protein
MRMTTWDDLKAALLDLEGSGTLTQYPDPRSNEARQPPFEIHLAPWADDAAAKLHRRFGDDVELVVGSLSYPERQPWRISTKTDAISEMDPTEMTVELDAPIVVASGQNVRGALRVHNLSAAPIVIHGRQDPILPNGKVVHAQVVDVRTGEVVGGLAGAKYRPGERFGGFMRYVFRVAPSEKDLLPMVFSTESASPDLGYAVPAGEWAVWVQLELDDGRRLRTPLLPITVTD